MVTRTHRFLLLLLLAALAGSGCRGTQPGGPVLPEQEAPSPAPLATPSEGVSFIILQMNDVYEITPVEGGRRGGLARVATLRKRLLAENPNTITVMAGDFFSPSAMGTARVDGRRLNGRQMVAVLNTLGLDLATFGNHEFDLDAEAFYDRLAEARFAWTSTNVTDTLGHPFPGATQVHLLTLDAPGGDPVRVAFVGATVPSTRKAYVRYRDPLPALEEAVRGLEGTADVIVALTHLSLADDVTLATTVPEIDLILGGHEHENYYLRRGADDTPILKADANARTVFVHRLHYDPATGALQVDSELVPVTADLPEDPETAAEVQRWVTRVFEAFRAEGFDPEAVVAEVPVPLDGREASVRNRPTALTELIAEAMLHAAEGAEAAVFNGGSIRIDDVLPPGPVTQYDVIRILPFGGDVLTVDVRGDVLIRALEQGQANRGTGGYLQTANLKQDPSGAWRIGGQFLHPDATYRIAVGDYLASGREKGLDFFSLEAPGLDLVQNNGDVRAAVIAELRRRYARP